MKNTIIKLATIAAIGAVVACGSSDKPGGDNAQATSAGTEQTASYQHGKELFLTNCASCHTMKMDMVGPPMEGVEQRWSDKNKLYAFIRNAPEVIEKDKYAHDLWMKYNQTAMTPFPDLTDEDIDAILEYVRVETGK